MYSMKKKNANHTLPDKPVCSICIANYNGIGLIHECLDSIIQQDCEFKIEIIVHDDASTDGSVEFIKQKYPEIFLIESNENVGFCVSNNRMVEKAQGKYILIFNNDAVLYPDALKTFHEYAEKTKNHAILGLRQYNAETGELIDFGILLDPFMNSIPNKNFKQTDVAMVLGACLWLPKILWEETGGFPSWFHTMHEDMYICCMARLYGYCVSMVLQSGYKHWVGKSLGGGKVVQDKLSTPLKRRALSEKNRLYVMVLCYPNPLFIIILPVHILLLIIEGIILSIIKRDIQLLDLIYLSAIRSLWLKRKKIFHMRHKIKKKKCMTNKQFFSVISFIPHKLKMLISHGIPEIT